MGENLKSLMGDAYHDGITVEEVETFFGKGKYVDLGSGKYVDKSKYDRVEQELTALKESTKDYDALKSENETFKAKEADATLKEKLINLGVNGDSFKYVKSDIGDKVLVLGEDEAKNKEAVAEYLKAHPQFAKGESEKPSPKVTKVVTTKVENTDSGNKPDGHKIFNDSIRRALGKKTEVD